MQPNQPPRGQATVTLDGWVTASPRQFQLLVEHQPPRPYGFLDQLREDARDWRCAAFWLVGLCIVGFAAASQWWFLAPVGLVILLWLLLMLRAMVDTCRNTPLGVGIVEELEGGHWLLPDVSMARAGLADGREVEVALPTRHVTAVLAKRGQAEVLFLYDPKAAYCMVIGVRATP